MVQVTYPHPHIENIHQYGVANTKAGRILEARDGLHVAYNELDLVYPDDDSPLKKLHESRIIRDLAHTHTREAISRSQDDESFGRIHDTLSRGDGLFRQALKIGNQALADLETTEYGITATNELLATHSVYGRAVVVAARVLYAFDSDQARREIDSASERFEIAETLPGRSEGSYYRASNAAHALRAERILGRGSKIVRWLGVAASTGFASIELGEVKDVSRTTLGRAPDLVTARVAWDSVLRSP